MTGKKTWPTATSSTQATAKPLIILAIAVLSLASLLSLSAYAATPDTTTPGCGLMAGIPGEPSSLVCIDYGLSFSSTPGPGQVVSLRQDPSFYSSLTVLPDSEVPLFMNVTIQSDSSGNPLICGSGYDTCTSFLAFTFGPIGSYHTGSGGINSCPVGGNDWQFNANPESIPCVSHSAQIYESYYSGAASTECVESSGPIDRIYYSPGMTAVGTPPAYFFCNATVFRCDGTLCGGESIANKPVFLLPTSTPGVTSYYIQPVFQDHYDNAQGTVENFYLTQSTSLPSVKVNIATDPGPDSFNNQHLVISQGSSSLSPIYSAKGDGSDLIPIVLSTWSGAGSVQYQYLEFSPNGVSALNGDPNFFTNKNNLCNLNGPLPTSTCVLGNQSTSQFFSDPSAPYEVTLPASWVKAMWQATPDNRANGFATQYAVVGFNYLDDRGNSADHSPGSYPLIASFYAQDLRICGQADVKADPNACYFAPSVYVNNIAPSKSAYLLNFGQSLGVKAASYPLTDGVNMYVTGYGTSTAVSGFPAACPSGTPGYSSGFYCSLYQFTAGTGTGQWGYGDWEVQAQDAVNLVYNTVAPVLIHVIGDPSLSFGSLPYYSDTGAYVLCADCSGSTSTTVQLSTNANPRTDNVKLSVSPSGGPVSVVASPQTGILTYNFVGGSGFSAYAPGMYAITATDADYPAYYTTNNILVADRPSLKLPSGSTNAGAYFSITATTFPSSDPITLYINNEQVSSSTGSIYYQQLATLPSGSTGESYAVKACDSFSHLCSQVETLLIGTVVQTPQVTGCSDPRKTQIEQAYCADLPLMLLVVLVAFAIAAIIFLVGVATKNDRLRNFGIAEIYEAVASAIMVAAFLYIAYVVIAVIPAFVAGTQDPYTYTMQQISNTITQAEFAFDNVYSTYYTQSMFYNSGVSISAGGVSTTLAVVTGGYKAAMYLLTLVPDLFLAQLMAEGLYALWTEYFLILFFAMAAIPAFVAPGVIFRSFLPTRGFGGMLMAAGIGFYIVMPTLFAFAFSSLCAGSCQAQFAAPALQGQDIATMIQSYMAPFWLMILFYPILIITLTYAFVTQLANVIGESGTYSGKLRKFI